MVLIIKVMVEIKIETYWNVNVIIDKHNCVVAGIKIETYWNVNNISEETLVGTIN